MSAYEVKSFSELTSLMAKHARQREAKVKSAVRKTASKGRSVIKLNVPVAFGELRESVHTDDMKIVVDAPHAAAVNNGSRPHWVPLDALVAWVKLRGMHGLMTARQQSRLPGASTKRMARAVSNQLSKLEKSGSMDADAPLQVARAIQIAIAKHGTRPFHFVEHSMPEIMSYLDSEIHRAMAESLDN